MPEKRIRFEEVYTHCDSHYPWVNRIDWKWLSTLLRKADFNLSRPFTTYWDVTTRQVVYRQRELAPSATPIAATTRVLFVPRCLVTPVRQKPGRGLWSR